MGIRSDIGIAVKAPFVIGFEKIATEQGLDFSETHEKEEGNAYLFTDIKWYSDYPQVIAVMEYFKTIGEENYLIVDACPEYPESDDGDSGSWNDNPFNLCKQISVSISITA